MGKLIDISGSRYGKLTVIRRTANRYGNPYWLCRCDCGNEKEVSKDSLRSGATTSCGCLHSDRLSSRNRTHGLSNSREYQSWLHARRRCFDLKYADYPDYGGRGITMCSRWANDFAEFYKDMESCPPGCSIDRIDNNGNYEPGNCRWATGLEQANNARSNILVAINDQIFTLAQAARHFSIPYPTLYSRVYHGQDPKEALLQLISNKK